GGRQAVLAGGTAERGGRGEGGRSAERGLGVAVDEAGVGGGDGGGGVGPAVPARGVGRDRQRGRVHCDGHLFGETNARGSGRSKDDSQHPVGPGVEDRAGGQSVGEGARDVGSGVELGLAQRRAVGDGGRVVPGDRRRRRVYRDRGAAGDGVGGGGGGRGGGGPGRAQEDAGEGIHAVVGGREGVVGRQARQRVGAAEVDGAEVGGRVPDGVLGHDGDAQGRAGHHGAGRGGHPELRGQGYPRLGDGDLLPEHGEVGCAGGVTGIGGERGVDDAVGDAVDGQPALIAAGG